jgi:hypothetical protein
VANGDPKARLVYSESMGLIDIDFTVAGNMVVDAGTEGPLSLLLPSSCCVVVVVLSSPDNPDVFFVL